MVAAETVIFKFEKTSLFSFSLSDFEETISISFVVVAAKLKFSLDMDKL